MSFFLHKVHHYACLRTIRAELKFERVNRFLLETLSVENNRAHIFIWHHYSGSLAGFVNRKNTFSWNRNHFEVHNTNPDCAIF